MPKPRRPLQHLRRIVTPAVALLLSFSTTAVSAAAAPGGRSAGAGHGGPAMRPAERGHALGTLPDQGIFAGCNLSTSLPLCEQDLDQMHQAGLQVVVMGAQWDTLDEISAYAAYAQSIGMSVMWELNDPGYWGGAWIGSSAAADWPAFSSACGCTDTAGVLDYMIRYLSALPATYGYYAADDWTLTPRDKHGLRQYVSEIQSVDPSHMVMVGSSQGDGTTYYSSGATMGNEIYPETTASLMPYGDNLATWDSVQQAVTQDQRAATRTGTASAFILQAFSFGDNLDDGEAVGVCTPAMTAAHCASLLQYPSQAVQLELRNQVLLNAHPKLILWYTFSQASQGGNWGALSSVVQAPYPTSAVVARAGHAHRGRHAHRRRHRRHHVRHRHHRRHHVRHRHAHRRHHTA